MTSVLQNDAPIGVFDSGVGGLTVARAIRDQLPNESMIYVGDTANTPYGPRPIAEVRRFSLEILDDLVAQGVKMLVIACNTASAAMLRDAHERYEVPVVEVIGPTVRSAVSITRNGRVGLIGTQGTIQSRVYDDLFSMRPDIELTGQACPSSSPSSKPDARAGPRCSRWRSATSLRCSNARSTRSCSAARTTRSSAARSGRSSGPTSPSSRATSRPRRRSTGR